MEFYQLKSFLTVAREGNLTKAAVLLHLSQSALSNQIKSLESEIGTDLFHRMPRGMELSFAGRKLLSHAETAVRAIEDFGTAACGLGDNLSGKLSVGLNTDPSFLRIADLDSRMGAQLPLVNLEFLPSQTLATTSLLNGGVLDVGFRFGKSEDSGICEEWIVDSRLCIVIPSRIAKDVSKLDWPEVADLPWIWTSCECPFHQAVLKRMDKYGIRPNSVADALDELIVRELVAAGKGVSVMRADMAEELAKTGQAEIWDDSLTTPLCLAYHEKNAENPLIAEFISVVRSIWDF